VGGARTRQISNTNTDTQKNIENEEQQKTFMIHSPFYGSLWDDGQYLD